MAKGLPWKANACDPPKTLPRGGAHTTLPITRLKQAKEVNTERNELESQQNVLKSLTKLTTEQPSE